ncbi:hypothetical protein F2Q69_00059513 [Brassica cretica]|uniref:Uncharacterized protein n=1 Tax=Brassica cretica TaxID=69181 RepID=A0A8S9RN04_BRACR|nr:hypothetical protein F2Q69_00059513 [Brassica cretica]
MGRCPQFGPSLGRIETYAFLQFYSRSSRWYRHGSSNGTLFLRIAEALGVKLTVTFSTTKNRKLFERHNLPNFPNTFDDDRVWNGPWRIGRAGRLFISPGRAVGIQDECSCARPGYLLPRGGHTCRFESFSFSLASLSVLAAVDPRLLLGQLLLFYPIEVFFFLGHGFFEGRVLPRGLASRSSWVDVSTVVRVIGQVAYIQGDALDFFSFVAPGRRWKVLCSWLCTWLERFIRVLA